MIGPSDTPHRWGECPERPRYSPGTFAHDGRDVSGQHFPHNCLARTAHKVCRCAWCGVDNTTWCACHGERRV